MKENHESGRFPLPSLPGIPTEILEIIAEYLPQQALHALMLTNSAFIEVAVVQMYEEPYFASTYRFAQFVHLVSRNEHLALLVRSLDISYITQPDDSVCEPGAGWREFSYRHKDMYPVTPPGFWPWKKQKPLVTHETLRTLGTQRTKSSHPPLSPLLGPSSRRNVPIGTMCHVLAACRRLKKVDLSELAIVSDAIFLSKELSRNDRRFEYGQFMTRFPTSDNPCLSSFSGPPESPSMHPWFVPASEVESQLLPPFSESDKKRGSRDDPYLPLTTNLKSTPSSCPSPMHVFETDIDNAERRKMAGKVWIYGDEIVSWLATLPELEELRLRGTMWINNTRTRRLVSDLVRPGDKLGGEKKTAAKGLQFLDLSHSGYVMCQREAWFGSREHVEEIVHKAYGK
ncbi:uncharacterized protein LY89DRAFT_238592 [Mollisia scopiformis]|uniref:F-box domain-containing protein n=1 Tax=Mollisia scopiformis TaxID=149040 RepID=A0A194WT70_MOLSC|nr:uncharacterized protein LY89DRAFT_238592 [Mollisia scopiformis]KUJ11155.1 hypothetical protein LY89DRAFT_238592 [Mollisia scopiformis]